MRNSVIEELILDEARKIVELREAKNTTTKLLRIHCRNGSVAEKFDRFMDQKILKSLETVKMLVEDMEE